MRIAYRGGGDWPVAARGGAQVFNQLGLPQDRLMPATHLTAQGS